MSNAAKSILVFGIYIICAGLTLVFAPNILLGPVGMPLPADVWVRMFGVLPARALYWPRAGTLFAADIHLGKAATFRAASIAIPEGPTGDDLARLSQALARTGACRLVMLGDLFHARKGRATSILSAIAEWR